MSNIVKGIVESWNTQYGYGFIQSIIDGEEQRVFVHRKNLAGCRRLKKFQYVQFEVGTNERGLVANNVEVIFNAKTKRVKRTDGEPPV